MPEQKTTDALTIREKLAIKLLLIIFKVVKPMSWEHQTDNLIIELNKMIDSV